MGGEIAEGLITAEELARMGVDYPCELVEGRIVRMSPTGLWHGLVVGRTLGALAAYVNRERLGVVTSAEAGFCVARDPDSVRAPDVAYLSHATIARAKESGGTFFSTAPDLAVEALSPDDTFAGIQAKVDQYLAAGAKVVWVASPFGRVVHVHEPGKPQRALHEGAEIDGGAALPGFRCPVGDLFQDLPR